MEVQSIPEQMNLDRAAYLDALEYARGLKPTATNISKAADKFGASPAGWGFLQWQLREIAAKKFTRASEMLFTRAGLEQATHEAIAAYRASRFPKGHSITDLCCGIGGDLIALGTNARAVAFEIDEETAFCASHNCAVYGADAEVRIQDVTKADWNSEYAVADPSRRSLRGRETEPRNFTPEPFQLVQRMRHCKLAAMKLSPLLDDRFLAQLAPEIEFISYGGECREAIAWIGSEPKLGIYATHVESGERLKRSDAKPVSRAELHRYFYEADPAAIRAHCLRSLCTQYPLEAVGNSNGYLTSNEKIQSVWLTRYAVIDAGSYDRKRLRAALRLAGGGTPIIKTRSKKVPANIAKDLKTAGENELIVAFYEVGQSLRFTLLQRA